MRYASLAVVLMLASTAGAWAQSKPPRDLVPQAIAGLDIRQPGSPSFRMTGTVRLFEGSPLEAEFEFLWASPESWQRSVRVNGKEGVRYGSSAREWRHPDEDADVARALNSLQKLNVARTIAADFSRLRRRKIAGRALTCTEGRTPSGGRTTVCVDSVTSMLAQYDVLGSKTELEDFQPIGDKHFPRLFHGYKGRKRTQEIVIRQVDLTSPVSAPVQPPDYLAFCEAGGIVARAVQTPEPIGLPVGASSVVRMRLSPEGKILRTWVVRTGGDTTDNLTLDAVQRWRFEPATCDGAPVYFELNVDMNFRGRR